MLLSACAPSLAEDDVAFLVPLEHTRAFFLGSSVGVDAQPLLPRELFDRLHALTVVDEPDVLYASLAVVAVRLDPCFQEGSSPGPCQPQLRLVLQPVMDSTDGLTTRDAAVHLFFSSDAETVRDTVTTLALARQKEGGTFTKAGWRTAARAALLPFLRRAALVRVTQMSVHASNVAWIFGGFEVTATGLTEIQIATLGSTVEGHVTSTGATSNLEMTLDPVPVAEPLLPALLEAPRRRDATTEMLTEAARSLARLQDPAAHNPGTVDCSSCHAAAAATRFLSDSGSSVSVETPVLPGDVFSDTRNLRAFGYFFSRPAISPRVQREITAVHAAISKQLGSAP